MGETNEENNSFPKQQKMDNENTNSNDSSISSTSTIPPERYAHLRKVLERKGPFTHTDFEASPVTLEFLKTTAKILIVGAGGLGCELVKNLALMGFRKIHIIDMDTIDLSNLNRQFLFRLGDVGKAKAEVAAECINKRIQGAQITPHYNKIQDKDEDFYKSFHIVVCGLDSVPARRWLNSMIMSLVEYDANGDPLQHSLIPIVDGGSEGFKGSARVIVPTVTACIECTLDLYPPQVNYPLCTLASKPRLPEHCIEYVRIILWPRESPFLEASIDGDDPNHINWINEKALERANQFQITGVNYRLTQGVVKHIIPAVASTNAIIAAACVTEVFKIATSCCNPMDNYMFFNNADGIHSYTYSTERKEDCLACSSRVKKVEFPENTTLEGVIEFLKTDLEYQMKLPGIAAVINGVHRNLFMQILPGTKANLKKTLRELNVNNGMELIVSDETRPFPISIEINYT